MCEGGAMKRNLVVRVLGEPAVQLVDKDKLNKLRTKSPT